MDQDSAIKHQIKEAIYTSSPKELQETLSSYHPSDVADVFLVVDEERREYMLMALNFHVIGGVLEYLEARVAARTLNKIDAEKAAHVLEAIEPDNAAHIVKYLSSTQRKHILSYVDERLAETLQTLSKYKRGTAGYLMTSQCVTLSKDATAKEALEILESSPKQPMTPLRLFVVDEKRFLDGVIDLNRLLAAEPDALIDDIMHPDAIAVDEHDSAIKAARTMQNYELRLLPVVNARHQLQGVVTLDDAATVLADKSAVAYLKTAGVTSINAAAGNVLKRVVLRLPWLLALWLLGLFGAWIVGRFFFVIDEAPIVALFMPFILAVASASGVQSLAITASGIERGVFTRMYARRRHVIKEIVIGVISAVFAALLSGLFVFLTLVIMGDTAQLSDMVIAVGIATGLAFIVATVIGTIIPMVLHQLKRDISYANKPLISALTDLMTILLYFSFLTLIVV